MNKKPKNSLLLTVISALTSAGAGFAIFILTGHFVFLPVFLAIGLTVGLGLNPANNQETD
jgi:hypothetical protein